MTAFQFLLAFLFTLNISAQTQIPSFTPNVVDPNNHLSDQDVLEINQALERIRNTADIWGAVYIIDNLGEETIESVSEKAFLKWTLGQKGKDNGLLLVLAMKDRKSRFEVGYGLEGDITDYTSNLALVDVLRPLMRKGEVKLAIINSFDYLAANKLGQTASPEKTTARASPEDDFNNSAGLFGLFSFLIALWLTPSIYARRVKKLKEQLALKVPLSHLEIEKAKTNKPTIFLKSFLTVNPGIFVYAFSGQGYWVAILITCLVLFISTLFFRLNIKRYLSAEAYEKYFAELVKMKFVQETPQKTFEYTALYYKSQRGSSSRSSGSSSSSSSSSGGGRSGGGGSSSSW
jgi:uncharacterized protein